MTDATTALRPFETTLATIRKHSPCTDGWNKLLRHLGKTRADDEPLDILTILESNGLDDALWCLRAVVGQDKAIRLYAVWCARQVQHLMTDPRSLAALDVAERYAHGEASKAELTAAWNAASASAVAAASASAWNAASASARDAAAAWYAAAAAWYATSASASASAVAASAASAWYATSASAVAASAVAARDAQADRLREVIIEARRQAA